MMLEQLTSDLYYGREKYGDVVQRIKELKSVTGSQQVDIEEVLTLLIHGVIMPEDANRDINHIWGE